MELLDLPVEILFIICEHMNPHYLRTFAENDMPLYQTSKTCRRLGYIAQQVLYHDVKPEKYGLFFRTIIDQPELAARVRHFRFDHYVLQTSPLSGGEVEQLQATAKSLNIKKSMYSQIRRLKKGTREPTIHDKLLYLRLLELSMALLPNIEMLQLCMPDMNESDKIPHMLTEVVQMKFLKHIVLLTFWLFNLGSMKNIFDMMPNLERLEMTHCVKVTEPLPLSRIRSLNITHCWISKTSLETLIISCPGLEYFTYTSFLFGNFGMEDKDHFTCGQAQRILHSRRTTLKHFDVNYYPLRRNTDDPLAPDYYYDSFYDFDRLETLRLQTLFFGPKDKDHGIFTPKFPADLQDLVAKLPMSLTSITFNGPRLDWNGITVLVEALQKGYFPRLKKVKVDRPREQCKMSRQPLLAAYGVDYEEIPT